MPGILDLIPRILDLIPGILDLMVYLASLKTYIIVCFLLSLSFICCPLLLYLEAISTLEGRLPTNKHMA